MYTRREPERAPFTNQMTETGKQKTVQPIDLLVFIRALGFTPAEVAEIHVKSNVVQVVGTSGTGKPFQRYLTVQS